MPEWIKRIYLALLKENGVVKNADDYVAIKPEYMDYVIKDTIFVIRQNVCVDYENKQSLKDFVQDKVREVNDAEH